MNTEEKVKKLLRLSEAQGYISYSDINDAFPDTEWSLEQLNEVSVRLSSLGIQILDNID